MPNSSESLQRIEALKAEIATLEQAAVQELMDRRNALSHELAAIDQQIEALTGHGFAEAPTRVRTRKFAVRSVSLEELKELLEIAPDKTLNIRKQRLDLANIKTLIQSNPQLLKLGGKGPWPTVTLLK